jgi:phospholipase C
MTLRDAGANNLMSLVTLSKPRTDTTASLYLPARSGLTDCGPVSFARPVVPAALNAEPNQIVRPNDSIDEGNLPGFLLVALRADLDISPSEQQPGILARFDTIKTRADAGNYVSEVQQKIHTAKGR